MRQINHSLNKQERWQRKNRSKTMLYNERYYTKQLIEHGSGHELVKLIKLLSKRLQPYFKLNIVETKAEIRVKRAKEKSRQES